MGRYPENFLVEPVLPSGRRQAILNNLVDLELWDEFLKEGEDYNDSLEFEDTFKISDENWEEEEFRFKTELERLYEAEAEERQVYQKVFTDNEGRVVRVITWEDMSVDLSEGIQLGVIESRDYFYSEGMVAEVASDEEGRIKEKNFYHQVDTYRMWEGENWRERAKIAFEYDAVSGVVKTVRVVFGNLANDEWIVDDDFLYVRQDFVKDWRELGRDSSWNPGYELNRFRSERNVFGVKHLGGSSVDTRLMIENNQSILRVYKDLGGDGLVVTSKFYDVIDTEAELMNPMILGAVKPRMFEKTRWEANHCTLSATVLITELGDIYFGSLDYGSKRYNVKPKNGKEKKEFQELLGGEFEYVGLAWYEGEERDEYLVIGINGRGEVEGFVEV